MSEIQKIETESRECQNARLSAATHTNDADNKVETLKEEEKIFVDFGVEQSGGAKDFSTRIRISEGDSGKTKSKLYILVRRFS